MLGTVKVDGDRVGGFEFAKVGIDVCEGLMAFFGELENGGTEYLTWGDDGASSKCVGNGEERNK